MELPEDRVDPSPTRLSPDHPAYGRLVSVHREAVAAGASGYLDPLTGLFVFTALALWERGYCCDTGCRHCPYTDVDPDTGRRAGGPRPAGSVETGDVSTR